LYFVGGIDEAGRGPLAGPVVAAVVVIKSAEQIPGVTDSKKLSARRREALSIDIEALASGWSIGIATVEEIDRLNILQATMVAMRRAVQGLNLIPPLLRIDGNRSPDLAADYSGHVETLVGGDGICPAIGAASILAKVTRDRMMNELHDIYPGYGFAKHRGYPTAEHRQALIRLGPSPVHRYSFRPVREAALKFAGSDVRAVNQG